MIKIALIRHGKTYGNTFGRYIGVTDEPLCEEGIRQMSDRVMDTVDLVFVSPMTRCIQSAELLYPYARRVQIPEFRECNFGDFENKNYKELSGNSDYQAWIDSGGTLPFPGGEDSEEFRSRCCRGFLQCVETAFSLGSPETAIVAHGGTIMSILSAYGRPSRDYFDWQIKNGEYYALTLEEESWKKDRSVLSAEKGLWTDV